ncbi:hypothetical protein DEU56DRAFT_916527 [Suillus clintonianus]|uniref:uncharacterized protein n=1 Tax=Suillus clintonianus TaxID=1904413 RepID=UPI001B86160F|nr:uncharacterized protein DEU56DRAFT_916527 [Suillus clintonianus]KAG2125465.1 hypothetical protein DEU56DRAFT_916527 [Suillus clintonianus]
MTQKLPSSSRTDTMVSVRLDGLINLLQCLSLDDQKTLSQALDIGTDTGTDGDTSNDNITVRMGLGPAAGSTEMALAALPAVSDDPPATTIDSPREAAPVASPGAAAAHRHVTVYVDYEENDSSDDEDAAAAAAALANDSTLIHYRDTYFNVPVDATPPLYYVTRGRYIGIFSGWDATGPKVLGVSRAIYHKVDSIEQGINIVKGAIDRAEEKIEAARRSRKAYYARNREEIRIKYQNKSNSKALDNTSSLKPARSVRDAHNKRKNKWARQCDDIDASLQVLIGSSSSTALVEGLCELFIANPDKPDSLDVLRSAHNGLEDLLMRAQTVENDVLEECGTGQDLSRAHSSVSHMAPRTWLTQEELAFIATFEDDYLECQKKGNYTTFWQPFFEQWEERWPARASLFPGIPMDQVLTAAQLEENEKFKAALQKRLTVKFRNDYGNSKPGRKAAAAGNSAVHKLLSNIVKGPTAGRKRPLKESEVYAKKYYTTRVQASVKDELKAIKEQPDVPDPKKTNLRVIRKHVDRCWENESVEVKEEISQLTREMREAAREAAKGRKSSEVTNDLIIPRLTEILSTFFGELHEATGWTFSVLLGGPDPSNGGAIDVSSLHVGSTKLGNRFNHAFSNDNVMLPYYEFVSHVFPEAGTSNKTPAPDDMLTNDDPPMPMPVAPDTLHGSNPTSQEADLAPILAPIFPPTHLAQEENFFQHLPPAPQDNEINQELDRPIIPMPEGYVPFCPPPLAPLTLDPMSSPTAFLNLDSNLESFDDALKSMQFQNTTTGLVCSPPHLRYQFDNFIRFSSPSTTSSTTPTITPSPAAPTTTIPITTSSVAAPTTPVTLGTRPSQLISGVGLDAQNPSNVVDERPAKRQKRAQCTRAGETDPLQAVSSSRGKQQRFQSTRAAAANAIG